MLIVGLGNPGKEYQKTRHNVGFLVVEEIAKRLGAKFANKTALKGELAEAVDETKKIHLLKPSTFMNASGESVKATLAKFHLTAKDLIVVYDDADLPLGSIRFRPSGSAGGHNGLGSIQASLPAGSEVARVRVGIGRPDDERVPLEAFVLGLWTKEEQAILPAMITAAADEVMKHT